jgi:hypothetical protein
MKNVEELRKELLNVYSQTEKDLIPLTKAKTMTNIASKVLSTASLELNYNKFIGNQKKIDFLHLN